jgi:hypothetical protein
MTDPTTRPSPARFHKIGSYKHRAQLKATTKAELIDLAVRILAAAPEVVPPSSTTQIKAAAFALLRNAPSMANLDRPIGAGHGLTRLDRETFVRAANRRTHSKHNWRTLVLVLIADARALAFELATEKERELLEGCEEIGTATLSGGVLTGTIASDSLSGILAKHEHGRRLVAAREVERLGKVAEAFSSEACTLDELARAARKREAQAVAAHRAAALAYAEKYTTDNEVA